MKRVTLLCAFLASLALAGGGCALDVDEPGWEQTDEESHSLNSEDDTPEPEEAPGGTTVVNPTSTTTNSGPDGPTPYPWLTADDDPNGPTPYPWGNSLKKPGDGNSGNGSGSSNDDTSSSTTQETSTGSGS